MGIFIKICGCTSERDWVSIVEAGPDAVGFIFWPPARRYVDPAQVGEWVRRHPAPVRKVGVFVDAGRTVIEQTVERAGLDTVQLCGHETPDFCAALNVPAVWKAIPLKGTASPPPCAYPVEALLIDYHTEKQPGGTGQCVDWDVAATWVAQASLPVVLAGGLRPENVAEAVRRVRPWGVDVSSGVETPAGGKDSERVRSFIQQCRKYDEKKD